MANFLDNMDIIDANNETTNLLFQDRGAMSSINILASNVTSLENHVNSLENHVNSLTEVFLDAETPPDNLAPMVPDGTSADPTDNTAAFQAIINYAADNNKIIVLHGIYGCSNTVYINKGVHIIGTGGDYSNRDNEPALTKCGSVIMRIGNITSPVIAIGTNNNMVKHCVLEDFGIYGRDIAERGIVCNRVLNSAFTRITVTDVTEYALFLRPSHTVLESEVNIMWNTFTDLYLNCVHTGLYMGQVDEAGGANCCYNLFLRLRVNYEHMGGYLVGGDNNVFVATSCYNRGGASAYPFSWVLGTYFVSNVFYSLGGTVIAQDGSVNTIFEYDTENGEIPPAIENNGVLTYTNCSRNGTGIHLGRTFGLYVGGRRFSDYPPQQGSEQDGDVVIYNNPSNGYFGRIWSSADNQWHNFGAIQ